MLRASCVIALLVLGLLIPSRHATADPYAAPPFTFASVVDRARGLAAHPIPSPQKRLPLELAEADYDTYRKLRFRPYRALWRNERMFEVQFFHPGFLYREPVRIHTVEDGVAREVPFDPDLFMYGDTGLAGVVPPDFGFAGFRLHFPLHGTDYKDEVAVFLGASYFRILGRGQHYGASARGLAIDTAMPHGEEFPAFKEFWLVRPAASDTTMTLYALLDSPRVTGAYRFILEPGTATSMEVEARLFARDSVSKLGVAPLTSMFLFSEGGTRAFDDFRPKVHDSDGLLLQTGAGQWIWRPLSNPSRLRISAFSDHGPRGFGLIQRDRNYISYLDLEAEYHRRPSLWVEPRGAWGDGVVELVEIPSEFEIHDNIAAYWVPDVPLEAGEERMFAYRVSAISEPPIRPSLARVVRSRTGLDVASGTDRESASRIRLFIIDYEGGDLPYLTAEQPIEAAITTTAGRIVEHVVQRVSATGGWRVAFWLDPEGHDDVDLTVNLSLFGKAVGETLALRWSP